MPTLIMLIFISALLLGAGTALLTSQVSKSSETESVTQVSEEKPLDSKSESKKIVQTPAQIKNKKRVFQEKVLPEIEAANARVFALREQILAWHDAPSALDVEKFQALIKQYKVSETLAQQAQLQQLLKRVNTLPPSLVLAQAANESAWGTSRFATQANNYFGMWCYTPGCGLVPAARSAGQTHEVAKYDSVQASVDAYMLNINRNRAYQTLRDKREQLIDNKEKVAGCELAKTLTKYSEKGEAYTATLCKMITYNKWDQLD